MCKNGVNNQDKNTAENKESDNMLTLTNQATIINNGKAISLFSEMYSKRATKAYWDECSKTSKKIDSSVMSLLKKKCNSDCK